MERSQKSSASISALGMELINDTLDVEEQIMGKINSPAGDIAFEMKSLKPKQAGVLILATMGVWESEIYFSYAETLRFFFKPRQLLALIMIPVVFIAGLFKREKK